MKKKILLFIVVLGVLTLAFQTSPYTRRIRPFASTPSSCQENEIGYNMTSHTLLICKNTGYVSIATGTGLTNSAGNNVITKSDGINLVASRITDDATTIDVNSGAGIFQAGDTTLGTNGSFLKIDDAAKSISLIADDNNSSDGFVIESGTISIRVASSAYRIILNSGATQSSIIANTQALTLDDTNTAVFVTTPIFRGTTNGITDLGTSSIGFKQLFLDKTITAGATVGAQTINKASGSVNFAAAATSLVVTNSLVSTSSNIQCTVATNDVTFKSAQCVAGSGSFTIFSNAAAAAETRVNFLVVN